MAKISYFKKTKSTGVGVFLGLLALVLSFLVLWSIVSSNSPGINLTQKSPQSVEARIDQSPISWNRAFHSSQPSNCSGSSYSSSNENTSSSRTWSISISSQSNNSYVCVRSKVATQPVQYQYSEPLRIDKVGPTVSFNSPLHTWVSSPEGLKIVATVSDDNDLHNSSGGDSLTTSNILDSTSITYALFKNSSSCRSGQSINLASDLTFSTDSSSSPNTKKIVATLNPAKSDVADWQGRYLCLKLVDRYGNTSYKVSRQLDIEVGSLSFSQNYSQKSVRIQTSEAANWQYRIQSNESTCNAASFDTLSETTNISSAVTSKNGYQSITVSYASLGFITTSSLLPDYQAGNSPTGSGATALHICLKVVDNKANQLVATYTLDNLYPNISYNGHSARLAWVVAVDQDQRDSSDTTNIRDQLSQPKTWQVKSYQSYFVNISGVTSENEITAALEVACTASTYGRSGSHTNGANYTSQSTGQNSWQVSLGKNHNHEGICFRVKDVPGFAAYKAIRLNKSSDQNSVIKADRTLYAPSLTLKVGNGQVNTWRYLAKAAETNIDESGNACSASLLNAGGASAPTTNPVVDLTGSDFSTDNQPKLYLCVEALWRANSSSQYEYLYQYVPVSQDKIDKVAPTITTSQGNSQLVASATDSLSGVDNNSYSWARLSSAEKNSQNCSSTPINKITTSSWRRSQRASLNRGTNHICFRVADKVGNLAYLPVNNIQEASGRSDTTPPTISLRQSGQTVYASSSASDLGSNPTYRYVFLSANQSCRPTDFSSQVYLGNSADVSNRNGQVICFKLVDLANNPGYAQLTIDAQLPVVTVSQTGYRLTASANKTISSWRYYLSSSYPSGCANNSTNFNPQNRTIVNSRTANLSSTNDNDYVCFRAEDSRRNAGHAIFRVVAQSQPINRNNQVPVVSFSQTNNILTATANIAVQTWQYLVYQSQPNCSSQSQDFNTYRSLVASGHQIELTKASLNRYYCFKATTSKRQSGYGLYQVSRLNKTNQPVDQTKRIPQISFSQSRGKLTATADIATKSWHYLVYQNQPDCDKNSQDFINYRNLVVSQNQVNLTKANLNHYYCFKATSRHNQVGFGLHQVTSLDDSTSQPPVDQTKRIPQISFSQSRGKLTATADIATKSWHYLVYQNRPDCDKNSQDFINYRNLVVSQNQVNLTKANLNHYYCFKATSRHNQVGFGLHQVTSLDDSTSQPPVDQTKRIPQISFSQSRGKLTATADIATKSWHYLVYQNRPDCDKNSQDFINYRNLVVSQNQVNLTKANLNHYYCFKATSRHNQVGFGLHQVTSLDDFNQPIGSIVTPIDPKTQEPKKTIIVTQKPQIGFNQKDDWVTVKVTPSSYNRYSYLVYRQKPTCNQENKDFATSRYLTQANKFKLVAEKRYYCFRVQAVDDKVVFGLFSGQAAATTTAPKTVTVVTTPTTKTTTAPTTTTKTTTAPTTTTKTAKTPTTAQPTTPAPVTTTTPTTTTTSPVTTTPTTTSTTVSPEKTDEDNQEELVLWVVGGILGGLLLFSLIWATRRPSGPAAGQKKNRKPTQQMMAGGAINNSPHHQAVITTLGKDKTEELPASHFLEPEGQTVETESPATKTDHKDFS